MKNVLGVLSLSLLLTSCGREPTQSPEVLHSAIGFSNNPDNGNPRIIRDDFVGGILVHDVEAELFALVGATSRRFGCAAPVLYSWGQIQYVVHDPADPTNDLIQQLDLIREGYLVVFSGLFSTLPPRSDPSFCPTVMSRIVGEGTANLTYTDNDLYAWIHDGANHNAFGLMQQGSITTPAGETKQYAGVLRCVWDGAEDDSQVANCIERINLR